MINKKFESTLNSLSLHVLELKNKGISVEPLNDLVEELKKQSEDILAIENKIESVQRVVIEPIRKELDENRLAGKFSRFGFYIGALGFIVTAISLIFSINFSSHDMKPFRTGKIIEAQHQKSLLIEGDVDCINIWVCLIDKENNIWPQVNILPSDMSIDDTFKKYIDIPKEFSGGRIILACVPNSIDDIYRVRQGGTIPVKLPTDDRQFKILRKSNIVLKGGAK